MKVKVATVAQAMACLLLKALVLGVVAMSQVLSLWWVVDNGVGYEGRYTRAVYMVTAQTIIGLLGSFVGLLLQVTGDRSPSIAFRALTIALPVALPLVFWAAYFTLGGDMQHASAYVVAAMGFFSTAVGFGLTSLSISLYIRALPVNEAARRATTALQAFAESGRLIAIQPQVWGLRKHRSQP